MTNEIVSFRRDSSALGKLQRAYSVCYSLCRAEGKLLLRVEKQQAEGRKADSVAVPASNMDGAVCMVRYLYENAVPIENWRDVLAELENRG